MRRPDRKRAFERSAMAGFTLVELLIVLAIIGLIVSLILVAALDGVRRAEERATQGLIAKLEVGVNERYQALLGQRAEPNGAHRFLAAIFPPNATPGTAPAIWGVQSDQRAAVLARLDDLKAEMPDVFFVDMNTDSWYPINFAAMPYGGAGFGRDQFILPLGAVIFPDFRPQAHIPPFNANELTWTGPGAASFPGGVVGNNSAGTGIYGASYVMRAAINKNLGYAQLGYDLVDNNQNGYIDEWAEGISGLSNAQVNLITTRLASHTHNTARSEALYAFLVEGAGPLGSVFSPDDFTEREVKDTDGDGLPEFVDAWGNPLQFYRWPIFYQDGGLQPLGSSTSAAPTYYYRSGLQKGINPQGFDGIDNNGNGLVDYANDPTELLVYNGQFGAANSISTEPRQQNPLDPNQQLVAPAWWWSGSNVGSTLQTPQPSPSSVPISLPAFYVSNIFHTLIDFTWTGGGAAGFNWDMGGFYPRGAYFSKFLIASAGPDESLGIGQLNNANYPSGGVAFPIANNAVGNSQLLIAIENTAARLSPIRANDDFHTPTNPLDTATILEWAGDDITNHNLPVAGGALK